MAKQIYGNRNCPLPVEIISDCDNPVFVSQCGYDFEKKIMCEIDANGDATGVKVLLIVQIDQETFVPTANYYNLFTLAARTGDPATELEECPDSDTESDSELFCDNGTEFLRRYVKKDGEPTGASFDTDLTGATYTASGAETPGACGTGCTLNGSLGTITSWTDVN